MARYGRWIHATPERVEKLERLFAKPAGESSPSPLPSVSSIGDGLVHCSTGFGAVRPGSVAASPSVRG